MSADEILSRLQKVKRTGDGRWIACCPAHDDRTPSMTIRDLGDGRILMHCFSGCDTESILGSIGLTFDALFPERLPYSEPVRQPWAARDVLEAVSHELGVIVVGAADLMRGKRLSKDDYARMLKAINRVQIARDMACQQ